MFAIVTFYTIIMANIISQELPNRKMSPFLKYNHFEACFIFCLIFLSFVSFYIMKDNIRVTSKGIRYVSSGTNEHALTAGIGEWRRGRKYPDKAHYLVEHCHGVCTEQGKQLHFHFYNATLQNMDAHDIQKEMFNKLRNKNISLFGDSLLLQLFQGMVEALDLRHEMTYSNNKRFSCLKELRSSDAGATISVPHGYNGFIKYIAFHRILDYVPTTCLCITAKQLMILLKDADIVILNMGLHYSNTHTIGQFQIILDTIMKMLKSLSVKGTKVVFRTTAPQHFESFNGLGLYVEKYVPWPFKCVDIKIPERNGADSITRFAAKKYGFVMFDDFEIFSSRWDLHQEDGDCTHYCFTMETIMPQLALLSQLL